MRPTAARDEADPNFKADVARRTWRLPALFVIAAVVLIAAHATLLRLPYFWDEAGYYIPAARDLLAGHLIPQSTPSNAHPPLVMAWLALVWKVFGQGLVVTRCAMILIAAFTLTGFFALAESVSETTVAAASTFLVAIYPVFFAQSSLAQVDLPAAGFLFWGLAAYVRRRVFTMACWFSIAALAKETAILVPISLACWELIGPRITSHIIPDSETQIDNNFRFRRLVALLVPGIPLAAWYAYHYFHTGFVFGNPEFLRYNLQDTLHPLRVVLALFLRIWQTVGYMSLYVLTLACLLAMKYPAQSVIPPPNGSKSANSLLAGLESVLSGLRPRISIPVQFAFLAVNVFYLLALSVLGGAVLARYMLPVVPLFILVSVSTIWRRLRPWRLVLAIIAASFVATIFVNPPYGFSLEDNLAYRDYIRLHQGAEAFLEERYPRAHVLTAWPASDEISRPYLGYVSKPLQVVRIEDFTAEQLLSASDSRSRFDVALVFSTKYQAPHNPFDGWKKWQEWKARYFGYHVDLTPEGATSILGGSLVYVDRRRGQWVGIIELQRAELARLNR